ncbi:hypothetical protein LV779_07350 [Streptomyces thinghirensis]|nr:hypothetical protein [Streptomyces thinghirensis]
MAVICAWAAPSSLMTFARTPTTTRSSVAEAAQTLPPPRHQHGFRHRHRFLSFESLTDDQAELSARPEAKVTWDKAPDTAVGRSPEGKLVDLELKPTSAEATASTGSPSPSMPNPAPSQGAPEWGGRGRRPRRHRAPDRRRRGLRRGLPHPGRGPGRRRQAAGRRPAEEGDTDAGTGGEGGHRQDQGHRHRRRAGRERQPAVPVGRRRVLTDNADKTTVDVDAANGKILREHVDRD